MPTGIEWCDETFNPWHGCEKVSPACAHCYAEGQSNRFNGVGMWGAGHGFRFQTDEYWSKPLQWARMLPPKLGRRPRVFCASMADVFEERDELVDARARLFDLIRLTPQLDWLILTKRPEAARDELARLYDYLEYDILEPADPLGYLPNVWLGVSIENARYTWRADVLREIPVAVRFISAEPLLGSLFERPPLRIGAARAEILGGAQDGLRVPVRDAKLSSAGQRKPLDLTDIDWVIAGGESGPRARPSHPDWFRELRDAVYWGDMIPCGDGCCEPPWPRPAFFFKQWGEWAPGADEDIPSGEWHSEPHLGFVADCLCSAGTERMVRAGKKANGRRLDGVTWDEFPASAVLA
jgi:protein gp37